MTPTLAEIDARAALERLSVFGAFHGGPDDGLPAGTATLVLLGPCEPGFWNHIQRSPEIRDGLPDPLDRWSRRVISALAAQLGGTELFPFGGPPYLPFVAWALRSGRAWQSPVSLLVHDRAGLMVSYRGALAFPYRLDLPTAPTCPCDSCTSQPCLAACPAGALVETDYDLAACHDYLDSEPGRDCMRRGCAVRRACPVSQSYGRDHEQSAFHMKAFHP